MMCPLFSPLVERAMRVAACSHRDQCRKASDLPYVTHPASVAMILIRSGFDEEEVLAAALLHDVVEDTDCTVEELAADFPELVIEYVAALTERKVDGNGRKRSWRVRKLEHLESMEQAPLPARAIALADKLHNLGTMHYDLLAGQDIWSRFGAPPEDLFWYYRSMVEQASRNEEPLQQLAEACHGWIDRLEETLTEQSSC